MPGMTDAEVKQMEDQRLKELKDTIMTLGETGGYDTTAGARTARKLPALTPSRKASIETMLLGDQGSGQTSQYWVRRLRPVRSGAASSAALWLHTQTLISPRPSTSPF